MLTEEEVLKFWDKNNTFQKSIDQRSPDNRFVFFDGPPFATGLPHYGHILASTIKDVIPRFWTMKGKKVERRWGWDCHGLPIENIIEQELKLNSRKAILEYGVAKFNAACRARVLEYAQEWKKTIRRLGRWVDMEHDYKTMDLSYMESIWWVFKQLWDKGLIYEGWKAMHICPRCETVLSNFEVTQGYKDIEDQSVFVRFPVVSDDRQWKNTDLLAWTTTAWTLPGNTALAVNPHITYVCVPDPQRKNHWLVLGKPHFARLVDEGIFPKEDHHLPSGQIDEFPARKLVGLRYQPLFEQTVALHPSLKGWKVYPADFVTETEGTGIVHIAPAFGEDDMNLGEQHHLPLIQHVGHDGRITRDVADFAGLLAKPKADPAKTDRAIAQWIGNAGRLLHQQPFTHSYPHCWRCETPLLNYSTTSWFVKVTQLKDRMIELNQHNTHWVPEHFREGRFGKWLEGARDWAISRSRFWGTPLPIWRAEDGEILCIGSREELEKLSGTTVTDLHKHIVDDIVITKNGKEFRRIPEVLDCWFESSSMPYAQWHYPFENEKEFEKNFPAEFIGEGQDQTRGWFYTLHVLSTALRDSVAFKNVIVNGIVLAEDGKKMSKRLKNYPEPQVIIDKYGADAMRMYLCLSPAMEAENLNFSEKGVDEVYKKVTLLAGNVLKFWELYAPAVNNAAPLEAPKSEHVLDQWIVAKTHQLLIEVGSALETYHIPEGSRPIVDFLQDLSTWYVRRSRDRFKTEGADNRAAVQTLGWTLRQLAIALAPFMPMLSEGMYQSLQNNEKESIHLLDWPTYQNLESRIQNPESTIKQMETVRRLASMAHQLRAEAGIKVRQPLPSITIRRQLPKKFAAILRDEMNVKEMLVNTEQKEEVVLDTTVSTALQEEGIVRELIRQINALRKKKGLTINETVTITMMVKDPALRSALENAKDQIMKSTIAKSVSVTDKSPEGAEMVSVNDSAISIVILA